MGWMARARRTGFQDAAAAAACQDDRSGESGKGAAAEAGGS